MIFALVLLQLAAPTWLAATADTSADCNAITKRQFGREADLPKGVMAAFGESMAEKGQPFQSTDVVGNPPLPKNSFGSAEQQGCVLRLDYAQGGRKFAHVSATFFLDESGWKLIGKRFDRDPRP